MKTLYSTLLVTAQFAVIAVMIVLAVPPHFPFAAALSLPGVLLGLWTLRYNRPGNFNIRPELREGCAMITEGPYRWIRHPMYSAVLWMMGGTVAVSPSLEMVGLWLVLGGILYLKARREEYLWCRHREEYAAYRRERQMFVPYLL